MNYDIIIIGAGPAGLMAAYELMRQKKRVLIIEQGKNLFNRRQDNPCDVACGIGGAGFFSDGKLSFFPAASNLWKLNSKVLDDSYKVVQGFLESFDLRMPDFKEHWSEYENKDGKETFVKEYDSLVIDLPSRLKIVFSLYDSIGKENILIETIVSQVMKQNDYYSVVCNKEGAVESYNCKAIVIAGGKHSYSILSKSFSNIDYPNSFNKREIGIRLEVPSADFDFYENEQVDVKLIKPINENAEIRTFCCCRDGIVIESSSYGYSGFNGISNMGNSPKSNIGINIRTIDNRSPIYLREIDDFIHRKISPTKINLSEFINEKCQIIGRDIDNELREFIKTHLPNSIKESSYLYFPSYEAIGEYPISDNLKLENELIWIAGDASGLFRGLTPAMVSGAYIANSINKSLDAFDRSIFEKLYIKQSAVSKMPVVFTAQSKVFFYCRDAVCEYAFNNGCLPVNPFRIFDYFLGDRVDRDIIRNSNNEMISRCDELWVFGPIADGVLFEIARCKQLGIPIRFFNIATRASEIREIGIDDLVFEPEVHARKIKKEDLMSFVYGNLTYKSTSQRDLFSELEDDK